MSKFTDAHVEQIRNMHKDDKSYSEIVDFMKDTYVNPKYASMQKSKGG